MYINALIEEHEQIVNDLNTNNLPESIEKSVRIALNENEKHLIDELFKMLKGHTIVDTIKELGDVMTTAEAEAEFGLAEGTAKKAAQRGQIPARKSGGTWLITRPDAEKRWKK